MTAPNIVNVATITGKTDLANLTTSGNTVVSNASDSNAIYKINSVIVSNIDGTNDAAVTVNLVRTSGTPLSAALASTITVPADSTLVVISKDMGIYLEEGYSIQGVASANGDLQAISSYEIIKDVL
jgi:hypothetical protein